MSSDLELRDRLKENFRPKDIYYNKGDLCHDYFASIMAMEVIKRRELSADFLYNIMNGLLPFIGDVLESSGRFTITEEEIQPLVRQYAKEHPGEITGMEAEARKFILEDLTILTRPQKTNLPYSFYHHEFRDYFSAVHKNNELKKWVDSANFTYSGIPSLLKDKILPANIAYYLGAINEEHRNVPVYTEKEEWSNAHYKKDTVLQQALQMFKGKFKGEKLQYAVKNIMGIILSVKEDLAGDDLSSLYLKGISFSDKTLSRIDGIVSKTAATQNLACNFIKSQIDLFDFSPRVHKPSRKHAMHNGDLYENDILSLRIECIEGKNYLYSGTKSEVIKWDIHEWKPVEKRSIPYVFDFGLKRLVGLKMFTNPYVAFAPVDHFLKKTQEVVTVTKCTGNNFFVHRNFNFAHSGYYNLYGSETGWLGIWDPQKEEQSRSYDIFKGAWYCFGKDDELLAVTHKNGMTIQVWNDQERKQAWEKMSGAYLFDSYGFLQALGDAGLVSTYTSDCLIKPCAFHPDKNILLLTDAEGNTFEWDYVKNKKTLVLNFSSFDEYILGYDPSGNFIITSSCKYTWFNNEYTLIHDAFDYLSIKHKDFGRLGFWSTADGDLKKVFDLGIGTDLVTKFVFHTIPDPAGNASKNVLIAGNKAGALKLIDYDEFISIKTLCPPVYPLSPIKIKYLPFSNSFIATYRNGLIRKFQDETHICTASVKGTLGTPDQIYFSSDLLKMAVRELKTSSIEIWNLDNLTLEDSITEGLQGIKVSDMRFNLQNDKLYIIGELSLPLPEGKSFKEMSMDEKLSYFLAASELPHMLFVYDLKLKKIIKRQALPTQVLDWDFTLLPSGTSIIYVSKNDRKKIIIHDLEQEKTQAHTLDQEVKMTDFGKTAYCAGLTQKTGNFTIILIDGSIHYCDYHEVEGRIGFRVIGKIEEVDRFTSFSTYAVINNAACILLSRDIYESPAIHERYEYNLMTHTLTQVSAYEETVDRDVYFGEAYYTERDYDYNSKTGNQLIIHQNSVTEIFIKEISRELGKTITTHAGNSNSINVAGCKFPYVHTVFDESLMAIAYSLERNGAVFPLSYHGINYPYTYQNWVNKNIHLIKQSTIGGKIAFALALLLVRITNGLMKLFSPGKRKYRKQDHSNPYITTPQGDGKPLGGKYYPSERYEWA